ncbi:hypothetical protein K440DRAFT_96127 [Wilcoxina mikolae CBS 423.85]|nr:hypothetical protein K440DRAFT_96127 [Wilcoxina mikolae CBS 423.85]
MIITVTLFGLQEGKGRAYQGEGRTLAVYALVVSCVLFFAVVFGERWGCSRFCLTRKLACWDGRRDQGCGILEVFMLVTRLRNVLFGSILRRGRHRLMSLLPV